MKPKQSTWYRASAITSFPALLSTSLNIVKLLVMVPGISKPVFGWYFESFNQWRMDGSPSNQPVTHFMILPRNPKQP